ncbi:MAG: response regulator [Tahibacter sp.]
MARILIIEDNRENLELMSYLLTAFGHTPIGCTDGENGIDAARREPPDLIVCDIHLPGADGYAVAGALKSTDSTRRIPLIAVTALAMVGDRERGLAAGFDGYLFKPIDPQNFVAEVEAWLPAHKHGHHPVLHGAAVALHTAETRKMATVLVVDDSPVNSELIRATLAPSGYTVRLASGTLEALDLALKQPPDMILSDVHMPGEDGFELIRRVKLEATLAHLPFLFISSSVWGEADRARAAELGISRFILRPIEPHILLDQIAACLRASGGLAHAEDPGR